jgi:hypothetical protein
MRAKMALVPYLGGVGKCERLIWDWSVQAQESGDLHLQFFRNDGIALLFCSHFSLAI